MSRLFWLYSRCIVTLSHINCTSAGSFVYVGCQIMASWIMMYTVQLVPQYSRDMFTTNNSNRSYNTTNATQLRATITRTAYYYRSFTVSGLKLWNSLHNDIKECTSISSFKWSLYNHMVTKPQF